MNPDTTEIAILMDASGSMQAIRDDAVGGLNAFVVEQKKEPGRAHLAHSLQNLFRHEKFGLEGPA